MKRVPVTNIAGADPIADPLSSVKARVCCSVVSFGYMCQWASVDTAVESKDPAVISYETDK